MTDAPVESTKTDGSSKPRRRRWLRAIVILVLLVMVLSLVAVIFAPRVLSSPRGRAFLVARVNAAIPGTIGVQSLELAWGRGQRVEGLTYQDTRGTQASIDKIQLPDVSLWSLLWGSRDLGVVRLVNLNARFVQVIEPVQPTSDTSSSTKLPSPSQGDGLFHRGPSESVKKSDQPAAPPPFTMVLDIDNAKINVVTPDQQQVMELASPRLETVMGQSHSDDAVGPSVWMLQLTESQPIQVKAYPLLWPILARRYEPFRESTLVKPFEIQATLKTLEIPFFGRGFDQTAVDLDLAITDVVTQSGGAIGNLRLSATRIKLTSDAAGKSIHLTVDSGVQRNEQQGQVRADVTLRDALDAAGQFQRDAIKFDGQVDVSHLPLAVVQQIMGLKDDRLSQASLEDLKIKADYVPIDARSGQSTINLTGSLAYQNQVSPIVGDATVPIGHEAQSIQADMTFQAFPVEVLDSIFNQNGLLVAALDRSLDRINLHITAGPGEVVDAAMLIDGPNLTADMGVRILSYTAFEVRPDSTLQFTATPALDTYMRDHLLASDNPESASPLILAEQLPLTLTVHEARVELAEDQPLGIAPRAVRLDLKVTSPGARFTHTASGQAMRIKDLSMHLQANDLAMPVGFSAAAELGFADANAKPGKFTSQNTLTQLMDKNGQLALAKMVISTDTKMTDIPGPVVDALWRRDGFFTDVGGKTASMKIIGDIQHGQPQRLEVSAETDNAALDLGMEVVDGRRKLLRDMTARFAATPASSTVILKQINPMLAGVVSGEQMIKLTVPAASFDGPADSLDVSKMTARFNLDLGVLTLRPGDDLTRLMTRLAMSRSQLASANFTPVVVSLDNGKLKYDKLAMNIEGLPLVFGGNVNLVNRNLNLTMGIPTAFLADHIKELRGVIQPGESLSVAYGGTIENPKLGLDDLFGQIAKLAAQGAAKNAIEKNLGPDGKVIGDVLNQVLGGDKKNNTDADKKSSDPIGGLLEKGLNDLLDKDKKKDTQKNQSKGESAGNAQGKNQIPDEKSRR